MNGGSRSVPPTTSRRGVEAAWSGVFSESQACRGMWEDRRIDRESRGGRAPGSRRGCESGCRDRTAEMSGDRGGCPRGQLPLIARSAINGGANARPESHPAGTCDAADHQNRVIRTGLRRQTMDLHRGFGSAPYPWSRTGRITQRWIFEWERAMLIILGQCGNSCQDPAPLKNHEDDRSRFLAEPC